MEFRFYFLLITRTIIGLIVLGFFIYYSIKSHRAGYFLGIKNGKKKIKKGKNALNINNRLLLALECVSLFFIIDVIYFDFHNVVIDIPNMISNNYRIVDAEVENVHFDVMNNRKVVKIKDVNTEEEYEIYLDSGIVNKKEILKFGILSNSKYAYIIKK